MDATRNLCAQIPISLHTKVLEEKASLDLTLSEYVTNILREHFEGGKPMTGGTKTLAFQIPEELFQRLKSHLDAQQQRTGRKVSQREFIVGLIEQALADTQTVSAE